MARQGGGGTNVAVGAVVVVDVVAATDGVATANGVVWTVGVDTIEDACGAEVAANVAAV